MSQAESLRQVEALTMKHGLDQKAAERLRALFRLLIEDPLAPTAVRAPQQVLQDHLADSLVALELAPVLAAGRIVDIGTGAGLPALPLAIARPEAEVVGLDSSARKVEFVLRAIVACGIANASAVAARAEEWSDGSEHFDLVTARALAPLSVVAEYAAPLLRVGGVVVAWRGRRDRDDEAAAAAAAAELGLEVGEVRKVHPYPGAESRHLHLLVKTRRTPERFPRRAGVARKRPLGWPGGSDRSRR